MKLRTIITLSAIALYSFNAHAQKVSGLEGLSNDTIAIETLDQADYKVFYSLSFVKDTLKPDVKTEAQTILLVGPKYSSFMDYNALRKDSLLNAAVKAGQAAMTVVAQTLPLARKAQFRPIVIKNYPAKGQFVFQQYIGHYYRYADTGVSYQWKLSQEEKQIGGYKCKKATCAYRGRNWVAWYCPDIVLSEGPYVFGGLPGLIMQLYDDRQHYSFTLNGLQKAQGYSPVYLPSSRVVKTTREKVRKTEKNLKSNPAALLQLLGAKPTNPETLKRLNAKPYNPIELE